MMYGAVACKCRKNTILQKVPPQDADYNKRDKRLFRAPGWGNLMVTYAAPVAYPAPASRRSGNISGAFYKNLVKFMNTSEWSASKQGDE
jgi:hypothetical protein